MSTQITLTIPDELYHRAKRIAQSNQRKVDDLLVEALVESQILDQAADIPATDEDNIIDQERVAYLKLHSILWQKYPGHHVAIYKGRLIDHDLDGLALSTRVCEKYPDEFVLIRKVESIPDRVLHFRSPRLIKNIS